MLVFIAEDFLGNGFLMTTLTNHRLKNRNISFYSIYSFYYIYYILIDKR